MSLSSHEKVREHRHTLRTRRSNADPNQAFRDQSAAPLGRPYSEMRDTSDSSEETEERFNVLWGQDR
jgi:hypothetical protein